MSSVTPGLYGVDVSGWPDLDPNFGLINDQSVLAQDIVKRLSTQQLFYDPAYGLALTQWVSRAFTDQQLYALKNQIETQCELDERVQAAVAAITLGQGTMTVQLTITPNSGPTFQLVVQASALNVNLIGNV